MMLHFFRRHSTQARVEDAIRRGIGVRESAWPAPEPGNGEANEALAGEIVAWVRAAMGEMRRPYGIDYVALALACRDAEGRIRCSNTFGVARPTAFYSGDGARQVAAFLHDVESVPESERATIAGALLSVGDLAHELGLSRAA